VLFDLARNHGNSVQQGVKIGVGLTREEIAAMAGTAVETTIRQISAFRDEGILAPGQGLVVLDAARLAQAARMQAES
jgi:CRP-like cAMP-binding protein